MNSNVNPTTHNKQNKKTTMQQKAKKNKSTHQTHKQHTENNIHAPYEQQARPNMAKQNGKVLEDPPRDAGNREIGRAELALFDEHEKHWLKIEEQENESLKLDI